MPKTEKAKAAPPSGAEMSQESYKVLHDRLVQQRQEILDMYKQDVKAGQESADDGTEDIVDRANNSYNRELMFSLSDSERVLLLQIEAALSRIETGIYGRCTNCGNMIHPLRLEAVPWARFCIDCQELAEKGQLEAEVS